MKDLNLTNLNNLINNSLTAWILFMGFGFFAGSFLNCLVLPKIFKKIDICAVSKDHNPGAANVFIHCGIPLGLLCLSLDIFKGFLPIYLAKRVLPITNLMFALIMLAPVLGHAFSPLNNFHGGKCIATSFGVLIALMPQCYIVVVLAVLYITFSTIIRISPHRKRSIITYTSFGIIAGYILMQDNLASIAFGCIAISMIVIMKHLKHNKEEKEADEKELASS